MSAAGKRVRNEINPEMRYEKKSFSLGGGIFKSQAA
jgi:hypothetical protein